MKTEQDVVWMKVTHDKYELPIAFADTQEELARIVGTTKNAVATGVSHYIHGRSWTCYRKVILSED